MACALGRHFIISFWNLKTDKLRTRTSITIIFPSLVQNRLCVLDHLISFWNDVKSKLSNHINNRLSFVKVRCQKIARTVFKNWRCRCHQLKKPNRWEKLLIYSGLYNNTIRNMIGTVLSFWSWGYNTVVELLPHIQGCFRCTVNIAK